MRKIKAIPRNYLGGYTARGKVWVNKAVPKRFRKRVRAHEEHELKLRKKGWSYKAAHKSALKVEHRGLSKKGIARYEGHMGAIVRKIKRG